MNKNWSKASKHNSQFFENEDKTIRFSEIKNTNPNLPTAPSKRDLYFKDLANIEEIIKQHDRKVILQDSWFIKCFYNFTFYFVLKFLNLKFITKHYFYEIKVQKTTRKTLTLSNDSLFMKIFTKILDAVILLVVGIIIIFPFYWMLITSFKTYDEVAPGIDQTIWPKIWSLQAYKEMIRVANEMGQMNDVNITRFFMNSAFVAIVSTVLQLFIALLGGFAIYNWKTKINPIFMIIMFSVMMIPGEALLMGRYVLVDRMGWQNNILALIVPFIGNVFSIYLVSNAFMALGPELRRASKIDGLSNFQYFVKIAAPAITSTLITAFITGLIASWNSILWPITIMDQNGVWTTIPMLLYKFINLSGLEVGNGAPNDPINVKMAACIICILPMIIMFVVFNRPIINGLTKRNAGGTKG